MFKKFLITTFIILVFLTSTKVQVNAQTSNITITPAIAEIKAGEKYILDISNNYDISAQMKITPALFEINNKERKVELAPEELTNSIDLSPYLGITEDSFFIDPNSRKSIEIEYIQEYPNYLLGVLVLSQNNSDSQVGINVRFASYIVDSTLSSEELDLIENNLKVDFDLGISTLNFKKTSTLKTNISNETSKIIKPFGEIVIYDGNTKIDSISLSSKLPAALYPGNSSEVLSEFTDSRPFYERIGKIEYKQQVLINNQIISSTKTVYSIPIELMVIVSIFLITILVFVKIKYLKKNKDPKKPKETITIGKQKVKKLKGKHSLYLE